jgi:hypothetical protein
MEEKPHIKDNIVSKKYAGKVWLNDKVLIFFIAVIFFAFAGTDEIIKHPVGYGLGLLALITLSYMSYSLSLNYFILKGDKLVIKNHFNFDECTTLAVSEIAVIEFGVAAKNRKSILVTTKDGRKKLFIADSLGRKQWKEFKKDIAAASITIKDEGSVLFYP